MATGTIRKQTPEERRRRRIRAKISGAPDRPRMTVCKTLNHMYVQLVDDTRGVTLLSASTNDKSVKSDMSSAKNKTDRAKKIGMAIAKAAQEKGITTVVFDRNRFRYHGRIRAVAEGAREGGLKF